MDENDNNFLASQRFKTALFLLVLGLFIVLCAIMMGPFVKPLAWTLTLTIVCTPIYHFCAKKIKNQSGAALLALAIVVLVIILPTILLGIGISRQALDFSQRIQLDLDDLNYRHMMELAHKPAFENSYKFLYKQFGVSKEKIMPVLSNFLGEISGTIGKYSLELAKDLVGNFFWLCFVLFAFFYFLRDGDQIINFLKDFIPLKPEETQKIFSRTSATIKATVYSWIVIGAVQGTLVGIIFWILGVPAPLLWSGVTAVMCFIPFAGAPAVWVPAAIILAVKGLYWKAVIMALWGALVVGSSDNILRPILMGGQLKLHILPVFISIFGGLFILGPVGMVMGPVILSITHTLLDVLRDKLNSKPIE